METLNWVCVIPPVLVVILAVRTKNIFLSLTSGIICGLAIFGCMAAPGVLEGRNVLDMTVYGVKLMAESICSEGNALLLIFLFLLGGIIAVLTAAGCAKSFSDSAMKRLRSRRRAQGLAFLLGCLIFVDDYFNAITVGNVAVSVTDKFKISRAKLAYIIDSTSAPVTILMPVSSWVATVISLITPELELYGMAEPGMQAFLNATVYNFYAWFTLLMVAAVILLDVNIGPMKRFEESFAASGVDSTIFIDVNECVIDDMGETHRGTTLDLVLVLAFLVVCTFFVMLYTGGLFAGGQTVAGAFLACDPNVSLAASAFATLFLCFVLFVIPGKLSVSKFSAAFIQGLKSMVSAIVILILSWTFSALMGSEGIMTGVFLADTFSPWLSGGVLPAAVFVISAMISFSTGASWGAMSIMFPVSIALCAGVDPGMIHIVLGATLSGSVFGDHCSPLADTTVLSSSGAGCRHLDHVSSQIPYALTVAGICVLCFVTAAFVPSPVIPLAAGAAGVFGSALVFKAKWG